MPWRNFRGCGRVGDRRPYADLVAKGRAMLSISKERRKEPGTTFGHARQIRQSTGSSAGSDSASGELG